jgi:hypothetical protein
MPLLIHTLQITAIHSLVVAVIILLIALGGVLANYFNTIHKKANREEVILLEEKVNTKACKSEVVTLREYENHVKQIHEDFVVYDMEIDKLDREQREYRDRLIRMDENIIAIREKLKV